MAEHPITKTFTDAPAPPALSALRLQVVEGPDTGMSFLLSPSRPLRVLLGTSPVCDMRLTDPTVSRRHLSFEPHGPRCRVRDLGSLNGTLVDGIGVVDGYLRGDESIRCGASVLRVFRDAAERTVPETNRVRFGRLLGASDAMRRLYTLCDRIAAARVPVLIEGETGTGKEVLAESLHEASKLPGPFVVFDCTTIAPSLMEAELFGHERGAFTGAAGAKPGLLEQANHGTLFIDEIGDLDLTLQPKLLRAVERGEVRRIGGRDSLHFDVRILCATRRDLDREVTEGRFRDDLFHRLAVARIELPPLRERQGDVRFLTHAFLEQLGGAPDTLSRVALEALDAYAWPGNVRELRNVLARRIALGDLGPLSGASPPRPTATESDDDAPDLSAAMDRWVGNLLSRQVPFPIARRNAQDVFEKSYVAAVLRVHGGNVSKASIASGIARRYFQVIKARQPPTFSR